MIMHLQLKNNMYKLGWVCLFGCGITAAINIFTICRINQFIIDNEIKRERFLNNINELILNINIEKNQKDNIICYKKEQMSDASTITTITSDFYNEHENIVENDPEDLVENEVFIKRNDSIESLLDSYNILL